MLFGFVRGRKRKTADAPAVPPGMRVYAVGDVHGRLDLLDRLHEAIAADAAAAGDRVRYIVYLGDYVDRGPQSSGVVERLLQGPPPGFGAVPLRGNHENTLLEFLVDAGVGASWLRHGGAATLASYGVAFDEGVGATERIDLLQSRLRERLPERHRAFLAGTRTWLTIGDYHFVHAGVRPGVPLDRQDDDDRLWIREEFLRCRDDFGKVVVHGHTIAPKPEVRSNRIGIDTGAYATNRLTCLVLDGTERRFLGT